MEPEPTPIQAVASGSSQRIGHYHFDAVSEAWEWSDELFLIHGYEPGTVEVTTEVLLEHKHPEDRDTAVRDIGDALLSATPFSSYHRIITASGDVRHVVAVGAGAVDEQGAVVALNGFFIDMTRDVHEGETAAANEAVSASAEHRARIEQAKGMVMLTYNLDADAAFELLRYWSMQFNVKVHVLAERLVAAGAKAEIADPGARVRVDQLIQDLASQK